MSNINERPVCHRAEDLVTYLYGEASAADAQDFAGHLHQCEACRAEFAIFQGVHESIVVWRNEALGASAAPSTHSVPALVTATPFVQPERKLSAIAALREFFSVSPVWLRGATAVAAVLLCVLVALAVSRLWQKPAQLAKDDNRPKYSQKEFDKEVQRQLDDRMAGQNQPGSATLRVQPGIEKPKNNPVRPQLTANGSQPGMKRQQSPQGLTRREREQLAADLGLIPGRETEFPFVFTDEPD
jgi:hypothetical protein